MFWSLLWLNCAEKIIQHKKFFLLHIFLPGPPKKSLIHFKAQSKRVTGWNINFMISISLLAVPLKQRGRVPHIILVKHRCLYLDCLHLSVSHATPDCRDAKCLCKPLVHSSPQYFTPPRGEGLEGGAGGSPRQEPLTSSGKTSKNTKHRVRSQRQTGTSCVSALVSHVAVARQKLLEAQLHSVRLLSKKVHPTSLSGLLA